MKLPPAPGAYSQANEQQLRNELDQREASLLRNDRTVALRPGVAIQMYDTVTGERVELTVASGVLVVTAL